MHMRFSIIPLNVSKYSLTCKFSVLFKFILFAVTDVVSKQESADRDHSKTAGKEIDYSL